MQKLDQFLAEKGFNLANATRDGKPIFDGQPLRFSRNGGSENGWFIGRRFAIGGKDVCVAHFGDWRTQEKYEWRGDQELDLSDEERAKLLEELAKAEEAGRKARAEEQLRVADQCAYLWENFKPTTASNPYLMKKGLEYPPEEFGLKVRGDELIVPGRDIDGKLWTLQYIQPDGSKKFKTGGRIKGCFHWVKHPESEEDTIYVAEGIATAISIHLATGGVVASAFNAGNLMEVSSAIRGKYPRAKIVLCGDDDRWTTKPDGTPWNPGKEAAEKAAKVAGGSIRMPVFRDLESRHTDFNDLHTSEGLEVVAAQLTGIVEVEDEPQDPGAGDRAVMAFRDVDPLPARYDKNGKPKSPKHQEIADHALSQLGDEIIKQNHDLFVYCGTHWKHLELADIDRLKMTLQRVAGGTLTSPQLNSVYQLFVANCPAVPEGVDLFTPHPFCVNFLNGTLKITQKGRDFETSFHPHRKLDYLINVLQFNYKADCQEKNEEFLKMLDRVFEGEPDREDKIRAIRQMYGACLLPKWPHLFFLYGGPGTGKSTVMKIAARLVHKDNLCGVEPHEFHGFNMETMAGKLVNMDTDVTTTAPIADSIVKKIEDRIPFRIRRKGVKDLYAPIPSIHIFGGNSIPPTLEGASKAHDRRWTFVGFSNLQAKGDYDKEFHDWVFESSPQGILNFALAGLKDLLASRGHYFVPASGKAKMEEWQLSTDPVGQFVRDAGTGEIVAENSKLMVGSTWRIKQKKLWDVFCEWHLETYRVEPRMSRLRFYAVLRDKGYKTVVIGGSDHFAGIGIKEVPDSIC